LGELHGVKQLLALVLELAEQLSKSKGKVVKIGHDDVRVQPIYLLKLCGLRKGECKNMEARRSLILNPFHFHYCW
jgi:hypothetical protein